jgi:D-ribose pyranose/furanose isomerase RbsD
LADDSYTIKEILSEMRVENRDNFDKITEHLAKLNGKVALHVQQIEELKKSDSDKELRLRNTENMVTKYAIYAGIGIFFAVLVAQYVFSKVFS